MTARGRYLHVFGKMDSLAEEVSWSTGVSNMLEWLTWSTNDVLGVTKTRYRQMIVAWSDDPAVRGSPLKDKQRFVEEQLDDALKRSEQLEPYARPTSGVASPREALRRAKFFSEDYLNKEFDIFWTLVSDSFLDAFYGQFTPIHGGGRWFTHGNSGLFAKSTNIREMQMDNLSYNPDEGLLVANELKHQGKKNPDQILKYALMFRLLRDRGFIESSTRLLLLFIGNKNDQLGWQEAIEEEVDFCKRSEKSTAVKALHEEGVKLAKKSFSYASTTWG